MGAVALDTSILIGFLQADDLHHPSARAALADAHRRRDRFVLPAVVLAEVLVGAYRHDTAPDLRRRIVELFGPVRVVDESVAVRAAELRGRHGALRLPDALVIATGLVDDAVVLTCDRRLGSVGTGVHVVAP